MPPKKKKGKKGGKASTKKPLDIPMMLASRTKIACTPPAQCQKDIAKPTTPETKPTVHATPCAIPQHERHLCSGGTFIWLRSGGDALEGALEGGVTLKSARLAAIYAQEVSAY